MFRITMLLLLRSEQIQSNNNHSVTFFLQTDSSRSYQFIYIYGVYIYIYKIYNILMYVQRLLTVCAPIRSKIPVDVSPHAFLCVSSLREENELRLHCY